MRIYDKYFKVKKKYSEYVVLIKSGIFIEAFDKDAVIINKLLDYKLITNNNIKLGFPDKVLNKVTLELDGNHINYVVVDNDNIIDKKKYKDNNYNRCINDYKSFIQIDNRINIIYNRLKSMKENNNIDRILSSIEGILN